MADIIRLDARRPREVKIMQCGECMSTRFHVEMTPWGNDEWYVDDTRELICADCGVAVEGVRARQAAGEDDK